MKQSFLIFKVPGAPTSLGAPTSPSASGDADVSSASEGGKCETTFCETTFRLFRCVSIRHADGDVGILQGADETSASPDADETSASPGCRRDVGVPRGADEASAFPGESADSSAIWPDSSSIGWQDGDFVR